MDFGNALNALRAGHKVAREKWIKGMWLVIEEIGNEKFLMKSTGRSAALEEVSGIDPDDLLATDWEIVDG